MSPAYAAASDAFSTWVGDMADIAQEKWPVIKKILTAVITKEDWNDARNSFSVFINDLIDDAKAKVQEWKDGFIDIINSAVKVVVDIFKSLLAEFETVFKKIMAGFNTIANAKNKIVNGVNTAALDVVHGGYDLNSQKAEEDGRRQLKKMREENGIKDPSKNNISLLNGSNMKTLGTASQKAIVSAESPMMQNSKSFMNSISNSNTSNNRSIKIDKIEVKTQATDAGGLVKGLRSAFDEMFADELRNLQTDSTGIKS